MSQIKKKKQQTQNPKYNAAFYTERPLQEFGFISTEHSVK